MSCRDASGRRGSTGLGPGRRLSQFEHLLGRRRREQVHQARDDAGPSGLVAGAETGAVVAVEVLVEQEEIAPVRILLELPRAAVDGPPALAVLQEDARQPAATAPPRPGTASCSAPSRSGTRS